MDKEPQSSSASRSSDSKTSGRARQNASRAPQAQQAAKAAKEQKAPQTQRSSDKPQASDKQSSEQPRRQRSRRSRQAGGAAPVTADAPRRARAAPESAAPAQRKPRIGDTRPAPAPPGKQPRSAPAAAPKAAPAARNPEPAAGSGSEAGSASARRRRRRRGGRGGQAASGGAAPAVVEAVTVDEPVQLDEKSLHSRRGRTRKGQAVGRYLMCVHVSEQATHIAVLEGRRLIEFSVSRPADDIGQIHGNIYLGRVQSVLPGMETAFVDIGTPKNAVLYRGDVQYDSDEIDSGSGGDQSRPRIEDLLKPNQSILCQVTKNPIGEKGARLTQEVSLAGRFVVLVPNSSGVGISKRLPDSESRRLRSILDKAKPEGHGMIVRTAAEKVTAAEIKRDIARLVGQWNDISKLAAARTAPALLYREPAAPLRLIREELNSDYRGVIIDDRSLHSEVAGYVSSIISPLADRVEHYDADKEKLPLFERYYVTEQLKKALVPKVWLPSGGSLIIEHTEALTVVDVNTGKNVGSSSLEETVLANNLEAAEELARQLRLRDIGGIIVVDFVDMEIAANRAQVSKRFREALARDKTRTQVLDISGLGLVEMTRKRSGQGLLESLSDLCEDCSGRGYRLMAELAD
ncbi:MAG: Rne/Rng family ribonuclease [Acidimicrobiaceae bacterium]|nr:Rne/Rng family ribonuclease [Acidimicrobiaceae bacterium]